MAEALLQLLKKEREKNWALMNIECQKRTLCVSDNHIKLFEYLEVCWGRMNFEELTRYNQYRDNFYTNSISHFD